MQNQCHKCPFNGKGDAHCLSCDGTEQYSYKFKQYIFETYDAPEPEKEEDMRATDLPEDAEDVFRKALYQIFDLQPLELLTLLGIMHSKSLLDIADELTKLFLKNDKQLTRHHIFQLRKSMALKLPKLKDALLTQGQRKQLKI